MKNIKFIFDLDGTVTSQETLPIIASHFGVQEEIAELTRRTIRGNVPFVESFIKRVHILGRLPVSEINELLGDVPLYSELHRFITVNAEKCAIATGNLSCWVEKLSRKIGCNTFCSDAEVKDNKIARLNTILKKENVVRRYKSEGCEVVYIGDGNNDLEAMRLADIAIADGITHDPAMSILGAADYVIYTEEALCRQLNQLL